MKVRMIQASLVVLFFLQAIRVIFSTMFGIIYDQIFEGPMSLWLPVSNVLVIMALLAPALLVRKSSPKRLTILAVLATLARIPLSVDDANIRYWSALVILVTAGAFCLIKLAESKAAFAQALLWGVLWEYVFRVAGDTFDLSLHDGALPFVAVGALVLVAFSLRSRQMVDTEADEGHGIPWSLAIGVGSFLFLEMTLLGLPSAIARYSGLPYVPLAVLLFVVTVAPVLPAVRQFLFSIYRHLSMRILLLALAVAGFLVGYFVDGWLAAVGLIICQLITVASMLFALEHGHLVPYRTNWRYPLGLVWMLVLNFFSAFAFTYPYTLPVMRERGWAVYLVAFLSFAWGVLGRRETEERTPLNDQGRFSVIASAILAVVILICVWPRSPEPLPEESIRFATWNIHYGYDDDWHTNLQEMAAVIAEEGVDVIAMQEVDTGRMTSYSSDNAYFLARRLGMQVVYLPAVEHLTGIALLYKGPPAPTDFGLLTSLQEQTGIVHVELDWGSNGVDAYGIWMGLSDEDTLRQIEEALAYIGGASPAAFGGDFNARPEDPVIEAVRSAGFADPFTLLGVDDPAPTSPAIDPQSRIDFVWVRGLVPLRAWVSESLASDHRMVVIEVAEP